jgi:hypothetical protein
MKIIAAYCKDDTLWWQESRFVFLKQEYLQEPLRFNGVNTKRTSPLPSFVGYLTILYQLHGLFRLISFAYEHMYSQKLELPDFTLANSTRFRSWCGVQLAIAAWRTEWPRLPRQALFAQVTRCLLTSRRWPNKSPCWWPWTLLRVKSDYSLALWGMTFST